jgi:hypothetical protein
MRRPDFHALCALLVATGVVISAPVWLSSTANATACPSITAPTVVPTPQTSDQRPGAVLGRRCNGATCRAGPRR